MRASFPPPTFLQDRLQHRIQLITNLSVGEANHAAAMFLQPLCTCCVMLYLLGMRIPVNLHNQPADGAVEIHDKAAQRMLTSELESTQPSVAQTCPELALRRRLWLAQLTCTSNHQISMKPGFAPHPNPLPILQSSSSPLPSACGERGKPLTPALSPHGHPPRHLRLHVGRGESPSPHAVIRPATSAPCTWGEGASFPPRPIFSGRGARG